MYMPPQGFELLVHSLGNTVLTTWPMRGAQILCRYLNLLAKIELWADVAGRLVHKKIRKLGSQESSTRSFKLVEQKRSKNQLKEILWGNKYKSYANVKSSYTHTGTT